MLSAVGLERGVALDSKNFSAGRVQAMVDTVGQRVLNIGYSVSWMKRTDPQEVELERELTELARKWDNLPVVAHHPPKPTSGPYSATWQTPDSLWSAMISYDVDTHGVSHPEGFEIEEVDVGRRLEAEMPDSIKGQLHNPESDYYHRPNVSCAALLQPH